MINEKDLSKFSDPKQAQKQVHRFLGKDVKLYYSTRQNKKYMVQDPDGKWVHFGLFGAEDFTKHKDEERQRRFRLRNARWKNAPKWSPASLSYWILW